jgi:UDP-N-acetylmuramoyl-tripeptide--D-alanyl-D-alanine ligase
VPNALAAIAVGRSLRIPFADMAACLAKVRPVGERSRVTRISGITLIADCYNANPTSTLAALQSLTSLSVSGRRIGVLAGMRELGRGSRRWHEKVGQGAAGLDLIITVGDLARTYHKGIPDSVEVLHRAKPNVAARKLTGILEKGDVVLIKGSRAEGLETLTQTLRAALARARASRP